MGNVTADDATSVGTDLAAAIAAGDPALLRPLYAPDAVIWHNTDGLELTVDQLVETVGAIGGVATATVDVVDQLVTTLGLVQVQRNTYSINGGGETSFLAALIIRLNDERQIIRLDEYLDSAALAPLVEAIVSAQSS